MDYAHDTLVNLHRLWGRPVHIQTALDGAITIMSFDGSEHKTEKSEEAAS